jgi:hypothetical protein
LRLAIVGLALILAACGQQTPTATVAVFAPAAHETRQGVLAEQRDATRAEERASRSRTSDRTVQRTEPAPKPNNRRSLVPRPETPGGTHCGPGKKSRPVMVACWTPLVTRYPWPNLNRVWNVMACESGGDQTATGIPTRYGRARGLLQILNGPYDPAANVARAWEMSRGGTDWSPWDCA